MSIATEQTLTLRITRLIKAPRQRVFDAWITPDDIMKWFGPSNCQVLSAKVDPRVGGAYHLRMHVEETDTCEGGDLELRGEVREFKAPSRLVYTWNWSGRPDVDIGETLVSVDFREADGYTQVQLTHEGLPDAESRQNHEQGWSGTFDKLEKYLAAECQAKMAPGEFSWNELLARDVSDAARFYSKLFGWQAVDFPVEGVKYTLLKKDGKEVAGLMEKPDEKMPPQWMAYVTVNDADATAKEAAQLGATILMPPFDVPTVGRIAVFRDPQGASLGIFQPLKK